MVLTYNENNNTNEYQPVRRLHIYKNIKEQLYELKLEDGEILKLTSHHRIYSVNKKEYIAAMDLSVGDMLMYYDKSYHKIKSIKHTSINKTVYNLEVSKTHNFYVGNKGILVHNNAAIWAK